MHKPLTHRRWFIALAAVLCLATAVVGWSAWTSRPVGVPQAVEFAQATLSERMTSATVLALGEATHGTHEFQALRLDLLQRTVGAGFTTVALEEDFGCVAAVDAWVQGGSGTVEEALHRFGYAISRTREMAELLSWARTYNVGRHEGQRVRFVGVDVQRPDEDKALALNWLATREPDKARTLAERLSSLTDETRLGNEVAAEVPAAINELAAAITAADDGTEAASNALHATQVLLQDRTLAANWSGPARDRLMFDNLRWLVERGARTGRSHTLLFAHDGHVDRAGQATAAGSPTLGSLAAGAYGDSYRVIGTDAHHVRFLSGDGDRREEFSFTVDSAYRGMFAGTSVGYLELADARGPNADVIQSPTLMASAGEQFVGWYAFLPPLHSVQVVPAQAWDAVIYVEDSTPVTMAG
jgi:erythromycin esterase